MEIRRAVQLCDFRLNPANMGYLPIMSGAATSKDMAEIVGWIFAIIIFGSLALMFLALVATSFLGLLIYLLRALVIVFCVCWAVIITIMHPINGPKALLAGYREGKKNPYTSPVAWLWEWP